MMQNDEQFIVLQKACGLSSADAAHYLGIKEDTVSKWRRGKRRPGPGHLAEIIDLARQIDDAVAALAAWDPEKSDTPTIPDDLAQYEGVAQMILGRALIAWRLRDRDQQA